MIEKVSEHQYADLNRPPHEQVCPDQTSFIGGSYRKAIRVVNLNQIKMKMMLTILFAQSLKVTMKVHRERTLHIKVKMNIFTLYGSANREISI